LIALIFLGAANLALLVPHELHLAREFNVSILAIDFILFLFMAACAFTLPIWGYLCGKANAGGRKNLLLGGTSLWIVSSLMVYFAPSYLLFLIARLLTGIGIVVIYPACFSMVADLFPPEKRGEAFAAIPTTLALGAGAGVALANAFGASAWRPPFLTLSIIGLAALVLSLIFLQEPKRGGAEPELRGLILSGKTYAHRINLHKFIEALKIKTNLWLLLCMISWSIPLGIFAYKFMPYLEIYGLEPVVNTLVILWIGSGGVLGYLLGGYMGDWAQREKKGRILVSILSLSLAIIVFSIGWMIPQAGALATPNILFSLSFIFLGAILVCFSVPNLYALVGNVNKPENRGMIFSIFSSLGYLAMGIGVLLSGMWTKATFASYRAVLFWGSFVYLITILFWLPVLGTVKKDREQLRETLNQHAQEMH
jgi:predicted MFS family arabinose efflux permease